MSPPAPATVTLDDVREAAARIRPYIERTPCWASGWLSTETSEVHVKWESLQTTGSFKLRGALHKLLQLRGRGVERVLTVSAGNHGLGVAYAARLLGMAATVVVPGGAAPTKVEAIRALGVELLTLGADWDEAEAATRALAAKQQMEFVSPYNDAEVIAGQGTVMLEIAEQAASLDVLLVPVGGGGLVAGVALVAAALGGPRVVGVVPEAAPSMERALAAGRLVSVPQLPTLADGLSGNIEAGSISFPLVQAHVDRVVTVSEGAIARAIAGFVAHDHLVVEGSGAVVAAALLEERVARRGRIGLLVTGRNLDVARLRAALDQ